MHLFDIILLIILSLSFIWGFRKGFIQTLASLLALILGIYVSVHYTSDLSQVLHQWFNWSKNTSHWVGFIILFIATVTGVVFVGKLITRLAGAIALGWINRLLGGLLYGLQTVIILSYLIWFLNQVHLMPYVLSAESQKESKTYEKLAGVAPNLTPIIKDLWAKGGKTNPKKNDSQATEDPR